MVLVDSSHEDQIARTRRQLSDESWRQVAGFSSGSNNAERIDLEASAAEVAATARPAATDRQGSSVACGR